MSTPLPIQRRLLDTDEAATYLHIGRRKMQYLLKEGDVRKIRIGNRTLVDQADLDDYIERLKRSI